MKKTLIITAHPSSESFTHQIATTISAQNKNAEIIDLYDEKWAMNFLKFESPNEMPEPPVKKVLQEKVAAAHELIFIFPIWNGAEPAILKNFYDQVFSAKFAFEYSKKSARGLLHRKTAQFFCTCDGSGVFYRWKICPLRATWQFFRMRFCGIQTRHFFVFGKTRKRNKNDRAKILQKIKKTA
ncbi:NAD(P)H-dependent oxidoreductase [bacterium]|jgi:NAD(P)H dehydrogenase (quinone)|nr:NAD(P)H-dependent oxidoreductase [bacterium]MBT6832042.1 NAD(P)H-dependent oxidoreductase [bacterium]MBT6995823.1 NAD(P)H-dependent oxidoreductase [bacterium]MBT7772366.1 NAD(P)H-dependent oxidoreductase [bacterium]